MMSKNVLPHFSVHSVYTWWRRPNKNEATSASHPTDATVQDKMKRISLNVHRVYEDED